MDKLTETAEKSNHNFNILRSSNLVKTNGMFNNEKFKLLKKKGIFPYEFIRNVSKLRKKSLPKRKYFFSSLGIGKSISKDDYKHALKV